MPRRLALRARSEPRLSVLRNIVGQELQGDKAMELGVFGLIHHTHTAATELFDDAVMRDGLADER